MFTSRTKTDLIIEVWEKLDCESVGAKEIEAIETVVRDRFGYGAVESPMIIARLLALHSASLTLSFISLSSATPKASATVARRCVAKEKLVWGPERLRGPQFDANAATNGLEPKAWQVRLTAN